MKMYLKRIIDDEIAEIANETLAYVLDGDREDVKHRALRLLQDCSKVNGYVACGLWSRELTHEEYEEYFDLVMDMVNDAHRLAYFGFFF